MKKTMIGGFMVFPLVTVMSLLATVSFVFAQAVKPIKVGCIVPLSGPYSSPYGNDCNKGVKLIIDGFNSKGGLNGRPIEIVIKDSAGSTATALSHYRSLAADNDIVAVLGPYATVEFYGIRPVAKDVKLPTYVPSSVPGTFPLPEAEYCWRSQVNENLTIDTALKVMAQEMAITRAGLLIQADAYGEGVKKSVGEIAPKYKIEIVGTESMKPTDTDMTVQLAKLRSLNPQIVLCGGQIPTNGYIAKSCGIIGWDIPLWATAAALDQTTVNIGGVHAEGFFITPGIALDDLKPGAQAELGRSWKAATSQSLTLGGFFGATTAEVIIEVLRKTASTGNISRPAIYAAMQNMEIDVTAGHFVYTPTSHEGGTKECVTLVRIKNGKFLRWEKPKAIRARNEW